MDITRRCATLDTVPHRHDASAPRHSTDPVSGDTSGTPAGLDTVEIRRDVLRLAVPALLTLVAEPLFLLADTAIVGHLGTAPLAGLGVASTVLGTAVGLFVFLAYAATALVSRRVGAGAYGQALSAGLDGLWLALGLGAITAAGLGLLAEPIVSSFGSGPEASAHAVTYLRISALGLPPMLAVLALTGVLRGLQDTRTPLVAAVVGFGANIVLNVGLVYGAGLGIAGAAWGTVLAQTGMAVGLGLVVLRHARRHNAALRPHPRAVLRAATDGAPLFVRTVALRAVILLTTWTAAGYGDTTLAAHQIIVTLWTFLAFALDALAIAGQTLIGAALGAGDLERTRTLTRLMTRWSAGFGVILGILLAALAPVLPLLFTPDEDVRRALTIGLLVAALGQPLAAHAFLLDGVLIGAGDARWLAGAQAALLVSYLPIVGALTLLHDALAAAGPGVAIAAVWAGFLVFTALRAALLSFRARSDAWLVTGLR